MSRTCVGAGPPRTSLVRAAATFRSRPSRTPRRQSRIHTISTVRGFMPADQTPASVAAVERSFSLCEVAGLGDAGPIAGCGRRLGAVCARRHLVTDQPNAVAESRPHARRSQTSAPVSATGTGGAVGIFPACLSWASFRDRKSPGVPPAYGYRGLALRKGNDEEHKRMTNQPDSHWVSGLRLPTAPALGFLPLFLFVYLPALVVGQLVHNLSPRGRPPHARRLVERASEGHGGADGSWDLVHRSATATMRTASPGTFLL